MATEAQQPVAVDSAINNDNSPVPQAVNGGPSESTPTNGAKLEQGAEPANKPGKTKEKEPPKDPHADPVGWAGQQTKAAVHKINYSVLYWIQNILGHEEAEVKPIPGNDGFVTRGQFVEHLRDGTLLAELANKLHPGSIATVHKGDDTKDKSKQKENIESFLQFLEKIVEIPKEQMFELKDLQEKGKAGYNAVLNTLFHLGLIVQEKFNQVGLDIDQIVSESANAIEPNFFQKFLNILKRANPSSISKSFSQYFANTSGSNQPSDEPVAGKSEEVQNGTEKELSKGTADKVDETAKDKAVDEPPKQENAEKAP